MLQQSKKFLFSCNNHGLLDGIEMLYLIEYNVHENFINSFTNRHANMSDVMCFDCFAGSHTFHGSCVHSRVCIRVCIVSHDMIECGMMWKIDSFCM